MAKTLAGLLRGVEVLDVRGDLCTRARDVVCDSRKASPGDLFVAVQGTRSDGNAFIADAVEHGAVAVITDRDLPDDGRAVYVRVADSRKAMAEISTNLFDHPSRSLTVIGVTGTNGKTTTTLILESILACEGLSTGVIGTLAYRWKGTQLRAPMTTPESLDLQRLFHRMKEDGVTHVVMEVSSHALALGRVDGCEFSAGVFTNLSQDHLDFHSTLDEYFAAKALLFSNYLRSTADGSIAVINRDDPFGMRLIRSGSNDVWSYSLLHEDARVVARDFQFGRSGIQACFSTPEGVLNIHSPLIGRLNLYNIAAAVAASLGLGVSIEAIQRGVENLSFVDGRLQRVPVPPEYGFEVVVDYAHTPDAMEKSIGCLRETAAGRVFVVFGCGGDRDRSKRPLMGEVAARFGDVVVLTSDNPRSEDPEGIIQEIEGGVRGCGMPRLDLSNAGCEERGYTVEVDRRRAIESALSRACPGDIVFIGGKGHETYQIVKDSILPFDDRMVVREYFEWKGEQALPESRQA